MSEKKNDSIQQTLLVALLLCVFCSVLVSAAAVVLKPQQVANKSLDKKRNILSAAGLLEEGKDVNELFKQISATVIDLDSGEEVEGIDPLAFDQRKAAKDPERSKALSKEEDIAAISRRENYATVYSVKKEGKLERLILPIHGYGLWSTLYGFVALESDINTVIGFGFYEHAETPGLGGEVDNPKWKSLWTGKEVYDKSGDVALEVVKGQVNPQAKQAKHQVDGLAGATLTSRGVSNLVTFWLGENGFGPYLAKLKQS